MRFIVAFSLLLTAIMIGGATKAAPVPGPYTGTYVADSVTSGNPHAFWTPLFAGNNNEKFWNFENNSGLFAWNGPLVAGNQAKLTGDIVNFGNSTWKFTMDVDFTYLATGGRSHAAGTLKCEFSSALCNSAAYTSASSNFEFFSTTGTLTGSGALAGFDVSFVTYPAGPPYPMPMQLGFGANNKPGGAASESALDTLGISTWLTMTIVNNNGNVFDLQNFAPGTTFTGSGQRADINVSLTAVPLPAALPLLLAGLVGLGVIGRRHQRAA